MWITLRGVVQNLACKKPWIFNKGVHCTPYKPYKPYKPSQVTFALYPDQLGPHRKNGRSRGPSRDNPLKVLRTTGPPHLRSMSPAQSEMRQVKSLYKLPATWPCVCSRGTCAAPARSHAKTWADCRLGQRAIWAGSETRETPEKSRQWAGRWITDCLDRPCAHIFIHTAAVGSRGQQRRS